MSLLGQKTFKVKASLIFGLAFVFIMSCGNTIPTWHKPYKSQANDQLERKLYEPEELDSLFCCTALNAPSYPGGVKAWNDFLRENIKYPKTQLNIEGKVLLNTTIDSTGRVSEVKVIRGLHPLFDEEAKRLVLASGKWTPATYRGKPIKESIAFFIHFRYK